MTKKEKYEKALNRHNTDYGKAGALANPNKESAYRDSALRVKTAYNEYAEEMREKGTPIPIWF